MARLPRLAVAGHLHLLNQRGHNGQAVFTDVDDRLDYLQQLRDAAREHGVAVHAYALPATEVLLLATPTESDALGRMMQAVSRRFVRAHNRRHGRSGTLWDGRFASTVVDPQAHGLASLLWVDAAGLATAGASALSADAGLSASSAAHHRGEAVAGWLTDHLVYWQLGNTPFEREARFSEALAQGLPPRESFLLRQAMAKGWALGPPEFAEALKGQTGRQLAPKPRGRPRKTPAAD